MIMTLRPYIHFFPTTNFRLNGPPVGPGELNAHKSRIVEQPILFEPGNTSKHCRLYA